MNKKIVITCGLDDEVFKRYLQKQRTDAELIDFAQHHVCELLNNNAEWKVVDENLEKYIEHMNKVYG